MHTHRKNANRKGATAIEYALICALIVAVVAVALPALGVNILGMFETVQSAFKP